MYYDTTHHPYTGLVILYEALEKARDYDHVNKLKLLIDVELDAVKEVQKRDTKEYLKPAITPVKPRGK